MSKAKRKATVYVAGAHVALNQLFARSDALKLVPPPKNETAADLNTHVRRVVGLDDMPKAWGAAA